LTTGDHPKRVLYHGPSAAQFEGFVRSLAGAAGSAAVAGAGEPTITWGALRCSLVFRPELRALVADLHENYVNLLVIDLRCREDLCHHAERAIAVLDALDAVADIEDRFGFHRILVLMAGGETPAIDALLLDLGARGVGRVLRHEAFEGPDTTDVAWGAAFLGEAQRALGRRMPGGRALCAAGGGITGIFFELGVLKCLDDCLDSGGANGFDMFFGISAGAVVTGPIAVGYSVDEYMAAIAGVGGGRVGPIDLRLFRLGHLDLPGFLRRVGAATKSAWEGIVSRRGVERELSREQFLFDYADLVAPPFRADRFEATLRGVLTAPGATNDFRRLPRPLYIGATDQDERSHVIFGDEEHNTVPISRAIQASLSINPAFSATPIRGRYYEDGAITRTSNFVEAMRRGATLIFVLDPFLPYVARTPGFNDRRGVLYNIDQDVRTISYTRYEATRNWVLRKRPDVSCYTFVPGNRQRRLISHNPMDHRPFLEIWRGAYLSTLKRLQHLRHRLEGDLRVHGVGLDLARAEAVSARLAAATSLSFDDFFPDGKVDIRRPPLVGDARPTG
jgi:predicted acylesterase/phospholipase RssA